MNNSYWIMLKNTQRRVDYANRTLVNMMVRAKDTETREKCKDYLEQVGIVKDLLAICGELPVPRVPAGEPGMMYMDAILRMVDGLTEAIMLLEECVNNIMELVQLMIEAELRALLAVTVGAEAEACAAMGEALMEVCPPAGAAALVFAGIIAESVGIIAELGVNSGARSLNHASWATMDATNAAIKIESVVSATLQWAMQVIAVPPVPELPIPICGWDIVDPYSWEAGTADMVIEPEAADFIPPPEMEPLVITGGDPTIELPEMPEMVDFEYPEIGFLGTYDME